MTKQQFDAIIKRNLQESLNHDIFGYVTSRDSTSPYINYYNNDAFQLFIEEMKVSYADCYKSYNKGKGSELKEKNSRYGKMPPKMASVASSSRFCYLALRNGAKGIGGSGIVKFEHECSIEGVAGTAPQLDAYIPNENIYVEAKCHEIFDNHKIKLKEKYWDFFYDKKNSFGFEAADKAEKETFEIPLSVFGLEETSSMFDTKQLLCHLLGIASQKGDNDTATLVYLFFKPKVKEKNEQKEIDEVFNALQDEIKIIFNSAPIQNFIKSKNITLRAVVQYSKMMESLNDDNLITIYM